VKRFCETTDFITGADEFFPVNDFFPNISSLYGDIGDNTNNANGSSSVVLYVILILLVEIMLRFLVLASSLELFLPYYLIEEMSSLFPLFISCFVYFFFIKSCEKIIIFPTTTTMLDNTSDEGDAAMDESTG
jgi:hypothetical protein